MLQELEISVEQRVSNGARWLDENFPGWTDRINIGTLELEDASNCICGQVFGQESQTWDSNLKGMGYWYAERTLFSEANAWILGSVPKRDDGGYDVVRANLVSQFLGFNTIGNECGCVAGWDCECDRFHVLQEAWLDLLASRGVTA